MYFGLASSKPSTEFVVRCHRGHEPFAIEVSRLLQLKDGTILIPQTACPDCRPISVRTSVYSTLEVDGV